MFLGDEWRYFKYLTLSTVSIICLVVIYTPSYHLAPPKQVVGWELNVTRETRAYVVPENETALISGKEICQDSFLNILIVVCSAPENGAQRLAIRETWASQNISSVKVAFLLGWPTNVTLQSTIEEESNEFKDIIQENFIDSYNNLTVKSVMMLKWFLHQCPSPRYLMKTDDDMFVNVANLSALLSKANSTVLIGSLICRAKPILDIRNKWYVPKYIYKKSFYPNYLSGTGYVMSREVAAKLYDVALSTPIIHLEDVYITGRYKPVVCITQVILITLKPRRRK
ncbi:beta-1,3-galactosyltransferase 1-like isoform X2 [Rhodnius prolixus]|uniref:beta-1,3-galactosyltransferase 1-like isoform X2 n=1 Tax=Rhodnius prolixus TaxID=13249 RepID=UPI003D18C4E4